MNTKLLLPLVMGILAVNIPTWASTGAPAQAPTDNSIGPVLGSPGASSPVTPPAYPAGGYSDTIPLLSLDLSRPRLIMCIAVLAQEIVVGPDSACGAGLMLTFRAANP